MKTVEQRVKDTLTRYAMPSRLSANRRPEQWIINGIKGLTEEVIEVINKNNVPFNDHNIDRAAWMVLEKRY